VVSIAQFQKTPILPHRGDWNFLGMGVGTTYARLKHLKKCMKIFHRVGEGFRKNPFCVEGMDIF